MAFLIAGRVKGATVGRGIGPGGGAPPNLGDVNEVLRAGEGQSTAESEEELPPQNNEFLLLSSLMSEESDPPPLKISE